MENEPATRTEKLTIVLYESERQKLEKEAWKMGMTMSDFVRMALNNEYKKILDEEVRQYEHSGVRSEIHKGAWQPDIDDSRRCGAGCHCGGNCKTGTEG